MLCSNITFVPDSNQTWDICDYAYVFRVSTIFSLWQVMLVVLLFVIFVTILRRKDRDDTKWFIFHIAILNLLVVIQWDLGYIFPDIPKVPFLSFLNSVNSNLAEFSIFPLAFSRFLILYYRKFYDKFFSGKKLVFFMLAYDLIFCSIYAAYYYLYMYKFLNYLRLLMYASPTVGTFLCSFVVIIKIHKMKRLAKSSTELPILHDLNRAAFVCLFQGAVNFVLLSIVLFIVAYKMWPITDGHVAGNPWYALFVMTYSNLNLTLYQFSVILDTVCTLFMLKSYRIGMKKIFYHVFRMDRWQFVTENTKSRTEKIVVRPKVVVPIPKDCFNSQSKNITC
jgi:hypothetical protein